MGYFILWRSRVSIFVSQGDPLRIPINGLTLLRSTCEVCVTLVHPCLVVAGLHRLKDHPGSDKVVGANFLRLVASHQDPVVAFVRVLQDSHVSSPTLFPFWRVGRSVPTVELRSDLEHRREVRIIEL